MALGGLDRERRLVAFRKTTFEVFWRPTAEYQNDSLFAEDVERRIEQFLKETGLDGAVYADVQR